MDPSLLRERQAFKKQAAAVGGIKSSLKTPKDAPPPSAKKKSTGSSKKDAGNHSHSYNCGLLGKNIDCFLVMNWLIYDNRIDTF